MRDAAIEEEIGIVRRQCDGGIEIYKRTRRLICSKPDRAAIGQRGGVGRIAAHGVVAVGQRSHKLVAGQMDRAPMPGGIGMSGIVRQREWLILPACLPAQARHSAAPWSPPVGTISHEDRCFRFMSRMVEPTADLLRRFTDIDHQSHVALLACVTADSRETMVGEARYIVDEDDVTFAEFAIAVASGWKGIGIGRMLLERLTSHAVAAGITRLVGDTLANNAAMIALARNSGFTVAPKR